MKKKYIVVGYWFIFFGAIVLLLMDLLIVGFSLLRLILFPNTQPFETTMAVLIFSVFWVILLYISGKSHFQWVEITQEGLVARCLWNVIVQKNWTQIRRVEVFRFPISVKGGFESGWFIFHDDRSLPIDHNYILDAKRPIMIKYNKRTLRIVKQFWKGTIE